MSTNDIILAENRNYFLVKLKIAFIFTMMLIINSYLVKQEYQLKIDTIHQKTSTLETQIKQLKTEKEKLQEQVVILNSSIEVVPEEIPITTVASEPVIEDLEPVNLLKGMDLAYVDVTTKSNLSGTELDEILKDTGLAGLGQSFMKAEQMYGMNSLVLIAISAAETGWGQSSAFRNKNNTHGITKGSVLSYSSKEECILYTADLLQRNYVGQGLNSLSEIQSKYCPPNTGWTYLITDIMAYNLIPKAESCVDYIERT